MPKTCTASGTIAAGDAVCVVGFDDGTYPTRPVLVARATAGNLASARSVYGISREAKTNTQAVLIDVPGDVTENAITSLGAGESRLIVTNLLNASSTNQCKLKRIDDFDPETDPAVRDVYVVGTCDEDGNVTVLPRHDSEQLGYRRAFSVQAYGAIPDGATACDDAFKKMFAAMQTTATLEGDAKAALSIAELGQGEYVFEDNLVLPGNCVLTGPISPLSGAVGATQLVFPAGKGVIVPNHADPRVGAVTGVTIRNVHIGCSALEVDEWAPSTPYSVGDIVVLPHNHEYVYECVKSAGSSQDPPGTATQWTTTAYAVTAKVYGDFLDGHLYECTVAGTSAGSDPFVPADRTWREGLRTTDGGGVEWKEAGVWPGLATAPECALCIGDTTRLETMTPNERVVWTSGAEYQLGDVVLVIDGGGLITDAVWMLVATGMQTQGGTAGMGPGGGWDTTAGNTTNDGNLIWTAVDPSFYLCEDGDCFWVARAHAGIYALRPCIIENVLVIGPTNAKIHFRALDFPPTDTTDWRITNATLSGGLGPGLVVAGTNSSAGVANGVHVTGTTGSDPDTNPLREWDFGIREGSLLGCTLIGCHLEFIGGYGYWSNSVSDTTFSGCYLENGTGGTRSANGVILGGSMGQSPSLTENSFALVLASARSMNIQTENSNPYDNPEDTPPPNSLHVTIASTERRLRACMPLGFYANSEMKQTGWAWSTEIARRPLVFKLGDPAREGWWIFGYNIDEQGTANSAYATSGPTAEALRDVPEGAAGMFWITQDHIFFGVGNEEPNCVKRGDDAPASGNWLKGDRVWNMDLANGYSGWVCVEGDGSSLGTWVEYGPLASSRIEKSLSSNFTTTSTSATPTNLTFPVKSGEVWILEFDGVAQCSSTGGSAYAIDAPGGSTVKGWLDSTTSGLSARSLDQISTPSTLTGTAVHAVAATPAPDRIVATVTAGADGDVTIQAASQTSMQTTTIFAGATLRARRAATV